MSAVRPCRAQHPGEDAPIVAGGFCDAHARWLVQALDLDHPMGLPWLYVELRQALAPAGAAAGPRVSGSADPGLPLAPDVDQLLRRFEDVVISWAELVRTAGVLAEVDRLTVGEALRTLAAHRVTLLALPASPVRRSYRLAGLDRLSETGGWYGRTSAGGGWVIREMDGVDAACELLALKREARGLLGHTRGKELREGTCASCGEPALVRWHGVEQVECEACGRPYSEAEHEWLVASETRHREEAM